MRCHYNTVELSKIFTNDTPELYLSRPKYMYVCQAGAINMRFNMYTYIYTYIYMGLSLIAY